MYAEYEPIDPDKIIRSIKTPSGMKTYIDHPTCPVCRFKDAKGKNMRMEIDKFLVGHDLKETLHYLKCTLKVPHVTPINLKKHYDVHSRYLSESRDAVLKTVEKTALGKIEAIEGYKIESEEVLEDIITKGGEMIKTGEMEVTPKLLIEAIREEGARKKIGTLQELMGDLDRMRFSKTPALEGVTVEDAESN